MVPMKMLIPVRTHTHTVCIMPVSKGSKLHPKVGKIILAHAGSKNQENSQTSGILWQYMYIMIILGNLVNKFRDLPD